MGKSTQHDELQQNSKAFIELTEAMTSLSTDKSAKGRSRIKREAIKLKLACNLFANLTLKGKEKAQEIVNSKDFIDLLNTSLNNFFHNSDNKRSQNRTIDSLITEDNDYNNGIDKILNSLPDDKKTLEKNLRQTNLPRILEFEIVKLNKLTDKKISIARKFAFDCVVSQFCNFTLTLAEELSNAGKSVLVTFQQKVTSAIEKLNDIGNKIFGPKETAQTIQTISNNTVRGSNPPVIHNNNKTERKPTDTTSLKQDILQWTCNMLTNMKNKTGLHNKM